jgi:hypothetical protein
VAFLRFARAKNVRHVSEDAWRQIRIASTLPPVASPNLVEQASEILEERFSPENFLLSHCSIVSSVDTYDVPNVRLGSVTEGNQTILRKWSDYRVKPECDQWINNNCFVPGALITLADGTAKPIEEVQVGEEVITHRGRARPVTQAFKHEVSGEVLGFKPRGTMERLYATREHPFFVFRANDQCVACQKPLQRSVQAISHLLGKFYCSSACYYQFKKTSRELLVEKEGEFVEAWDLRRNDFVASPLVQGSEEVGLTPGKARLVGLFLAEGSYELYSYNKNERVGAQWAFHQDEESTLGKDVLGLLKEEFGVEGAIRRHSRDKGIVVTTKTNRELAQFFAHWVRGKGATTKTLHGSLLTAPHQIQKEIVRGWFEGDGSLVVTKADVRLVGASANRSLINQVQIILHRLGVSSRVGYEEQEGRKRLVIDGEVRVIADPSKKTKAWSLSCGGGWIEDLVQETVYEKRYFSELAQRGGLQQVPKLRFFKDYHLQMLGDVEELDYQGPVFNLEVEEDHSYLANGVAVHNCDAWERKVLLASYPTFIGAQNWVEHVQLMELSKGRIIDAVARDIGDSVYVDILVATNRKHRDLITSIEKRETNSLSMGCQIDFSVCTKCGHVAVDETEMCRCVRYEKGNIFYDEQGQRHMVAELCGHHSVDPTGGVTFIEASWVKVPAFTGAVLRNILLPQEVSPDNLRRAQAVLSSPPKSWDQEEMQKYMKAATMVSIAQFDFDEDEEGEGEGEGEKGILDELTEKALKEISRRVQDKLRAEINPPAPYKPPGDDSATIDDENIGRTAYRKSLDTIVRWAPSRVAAVNGIAEVNQAFGIKVPVNIYRVALRVGSTIGHPDLGHYLRACSKALGRAPTLGESKTLVRLGNLLARMSG